MKSKRITAGLTAIFLGYLGIHKFVLGYNREGIIILLIHFVAFPIFFIVTCGYGSPTYGLVYLLPIIEGIIYLTKSDEEFINAYQLNKRTWF